MPYRAAAEKIRAGQSLTAEQMAKLIDNLLQGEVDTGSAAGEDVRDLLIALSERGETASELLGAATAMRSHMTPIRQAASDSPISGSADTTKWSDVLLDTCGTGGSGSGTFNISTATAIVVSAGGVTVAKHGNRKATSRSGSADVLAELGVAIESDRSSVEKCLAQIGICFCFAPTLHPAMKYVAAIRKTIDRPTMFNFLGPLCNPAGATHQLLGTGRADRQVVIAETLRQLGTQRSIVVRGEDGQDEVTLDGVTFALEITSDGNVIEHQWLPSSFGLAPAGADAMQATDPAHSAYIIRAILDGEAGPCRDIVVANAAAAFWLVGKDTCLGDAARRAEHLLDSGAAKSQLARFADF